MIWLYLSLISGTELQVEIMGEFYEARVLSGPPVLTQPLRNKWTQDYFYLFILTIDRESSPAILGIFSVDTDNVLQRCHQRLRYIMSHIIKWLWEDQKGQRGHSTTKDRILPFFFCQGEMVQEALSGDGGEKDEEGAGCKTIFPIWSIFKNSIWKYF